MKKLNFKWTAALCLLITMAFTSCKKDNESELLLARDGSSLSAEDKELVQIYDGVGEVHNQGLDFVYDKIKSKIDEAKATDPSAKAEITPDEISKWSDEFVRTIYNPNDGEITDCTPLFLRLVGGIESNQDLSMPDAVTRVLQTDLSPEVANALGELDKVLNEGSPFDTLWYFPPAHTFSDLLNRHLPNIKSMDEKAAFISAVSVAKNTTEYWAKNFRKWQELDGQISPVSDNQTNYARGPGDDIADADVEGAYVGIMTGAYIGATGGTIVLPVVGTVAGTAACAVSVGVGTAVVASTARALTRFTRWLANW